jgi:hypothetical protein
MHVGTWFRATGGASPSRIGSILVVFLEIRESSWEGAVLEPILPLHAQDISGQRALSSDPLSGESCMQSLKNRY